MRSRMRLSIVLGIVWTAAAARADEWVVTGPDALGQGGAGVAAMTGPGSVYWNPALPGLGESDVFDLGAFGLGVDVGATVSAEGDILKKGDQIFDFVTTNNFSALQTTLNTFATSSTAASVTNVQTAIQLINLINGLNQSGQGFHASAGGSAEVRLGWLTVFYHDRLYAGAAPFIDFSSAATSAITTGAKATLFDTDGAGADTGLIAIGGAPATAGGTALSGALSGTGLFTVAEANALAAVAEATPGVNLSDPSLVNAITQVGAATAGAAGGAGGLGANGSGFDVKAVNMTEVGIGVSVPVIPKTLALGAAFKEILGETSWTRVDVLTNDGSDVASEVRDGLRKNRTTTSRPSLDLGLAWAPLEDLKLGIVGKDVFGASFDLKGRSDDITIDPQCRAGVSWQPVGFLTLSGDADLTENGSDLLPGFESRLVGGGVALDPGVPIVSPVLRFGLMKNVAASTSKLAYTAGLDIQIWYFRLGVAGALSPSDVEIETNASGSKRDVPQRVSAAARFGFSLEW